MSAGVRAETHLKSKPSEHTVPLEIILLVQEFNSCFICLLTQIYSRDSGSPTLEI